MYDNLLMQLYKDRAITVKMLLDNSSFPGSDKILQALTAIEQEQTKQQQVQMQAMHNRDCRFNLRSNCNNFRWNNSSRQHRNLCKCRLLNNKMSYNNSHCRRNNNPHQLTNFTMEKNSATGIKDTMLKIVKNGLDDIEANIENITLDDKIGIVKSLFPYLLPKAIEVSAVGTLEDKIAVISSQDFSDVFEKEKVLSSKNQSKKNSKQIPSKENTLPKK
jgi:hypothetical protein